MKEALRLALDKLKEFSVKIDVNNKAESRNMLIKCAETALNSKLLNSYKN